MKSYIMIIVILLLPCCVLSTEPVVADGVLHNWGYKSKSIKSVHQSNWHKQTFGEAVIATQFIKSIKPISKGLRTYYRFTITKETYDSQESADLRIKNLKILRPPNVHTKMNPEYILREGFTLNNKAYIISTDVLSFSVDELPRLILLLKKELQK